MTEGELVAYVMAALGAFSFAVLCYLIVTHLIAARKLNAPKPEIIEDMMGNTYRVQPDLIRKRERMEDGIRNSKREPIGEAWDVVR